MTALAEVLARPDVWRGERAVAPAPTLPTGYAELDAELPGGGWPRGQLTELLHGDPGIGELSLLLPALAALTRDTARPSMLFLVAPPHQAHMPAWVRAGIDPARLRRVMAGNAHEAFWAAVQVLRSPAVGASLLWLEPGALLAANALRRLHLAAGAGGGAAFLFRPARVAASTSPAPLRLQLEPAAAGLSIRLLKRRGAPLGRPLSFAVPRPVDHGRREQVVHALAGPAAFRRLPDAAMA